MLSWDPQMLRVLGMSSILYNLLTRPLVILNLIITKSPQKSFIFYSADPYYLRDFLGPLLRVPNFHFLEIPNVRGKGGGGPSLKRVQHYLLKGDYISNPKP